MSYKNPVKVLILMCIVCVFCKRDCDLSETLWYNKGNNNKNNK